MRNKPRKDVVVVSDIHEQAQCLGYEYSSYDI